MKKIYAALPLAAVLALSFAPAAQADLEDDRASYEAQAEEKKAESEELAGRITSLSEEKRVLDEEADVAIKAHEEKKAALDATLASLAENGAKLEQAEKEYNTKRDRLGRRVRDIYMHGEISYLDVLFGAKDFQDLMTRMDLLKRIIREDYRLVKEVLEEKNAIELARAELEKAKELQAAQEEEARAARLEREEKVAKREALLERMRSDKATIDAQYDELMAASAEITRMLQRQSYGGAYVGSGSGAMLWPLAGEVTSEFGWREHPITGTYKYHSGLDIGGDYGQPIAAAQSGVVEYAGWISGYGYAVIIDHGGGISSLYGHCQALAVSEGQSVSRGETIAYCGSTGNSTGPHCHFEVREGGEPVSPYSFL